MDTLLNDIRYAWRGLLKSPGFALATILTLALGIGANTTMFGVLDVLLLRPPADVVRPDRVQRVNFHVAHSEFGEFTNTATSMPAFEGLRAVPAFSDVAAFLTYPFSLGRGANARQVNALVVSASYFPLLGVTPALGNFFGPAQDVIGAEPAAVLSYGFWQREFGGARSALGRQLTIGKTIYTVVGVAPQGFTGIELTAPDVWLPMHVAGVEVLGREAMTSRGWVWMSVIARLRDGVSQDLAASQATTVFRTGAHGSSQFNAFDTLATVVFGPVQAARFSSYSAGRAHMDADAQVSLWIGAVAVVVLLVACANVANLLLARGLARRKEMAVRAGLGAGRWRLVRLLLVESLVLALAGGVAGLLVSTWGGTIVRDYLIPGLSKDVALLDPRVLAFTAAVVIVTGVMAGLAPAFRSSLADVSAALKSEATASVGGGRSRLRSALVAAQVAFTGVLLVGAGLFLKSLNNVRGIDMGMDLQHILTARADLAAMGLDRDARTAMYRRLAERVRQVPGVVSAAATMGSPYGWSYSRRLRVSGRDSMPTLQSGGPYLYQVEPSYFQALGLTLTRGRTFTDADGKGAPPVAMVGVEFAKVIWPDKDPVGQCLYVNGTGPCVSVVGVVTDPKRNSVQESPNAMYYLPLAEELMQTDVSALVIRTREPAASAATAVQRALQGAEPGLPYVSVEALANRVAPQLRSWELGAVMFTAFGLLALIVAGMGLYGVTSYLVSQRTREVGLRMALGAQARDVVRTVMQQGTRAAGWGALLAAAGGLGEGRVLGSLLYNVRPNDVAVFLAACGTLLLVAVLAAFIPARRATRIDPMVALRHE